MKTMLFTIALLLVAILLTTPIAAQTAPPVHPSVSLSWTASTDAAENPTLTYNLYRAPGAPGKACPTSLDGAAWTKIASNISSVVYTDLAVKIDAYCYYVTAALNSAESVPSNLAPAVILPAAPTGLSGSAF